jgi:hypothetical protein
MDYETILERARAEAGAKSIAAFARELAHEWCEVYEALRRSVQALRSGVQRSLKPLYQWVGDCFQVARYPPEARHGAGIYSVRKTSLDAPESGIMRRGYQSA